MLGAHIEHVRYDIKIWHHYISHDMTSPPLAVSKAARSSGANIPVRQCGSSLVPPGGCERQVSLEQRYDGVALLHAGQVCECLGVKCVLPTSPVGALPDDVGVLTATEGTRSIVLEQGVLPEVATVHLFVPNNADAGSPGHDRGTGT